jgi:hypothetical protein
LYVALQNATRDVALHKNQHAHLPNHDAALRRYQNLVAVNKFFSGKEIKEE